MTSLWDDKWSELEKTGYKFCHTTIAIRDKMLENYNNGITGITITDKTHNITGKPIVDCIEDIFKIIDGYGGYFNMPDVVVFCGFRNFYKDAEKLEHSTFFILAEAECSKRSLGSIFLNQYVDAGSLVNEKYVFVVDTRWSGFKPPENNLKIYLKPPMPWEVK